MMKKLTILFLALTLFAVGCANKVISNNTDMQAYDSNTCGRMPTIKEYIPQKLVLEATRLKMVKSIL